MKQRCIDAVEKAIGRSLKAGESANIEQRIIDAKRRIAVQDRPAWLGMTEADRLVAAGKQVADDLQAELSKKQQRLALDVLAAQRLQADIAAHKSLSPLHVINRMLANYADGKSQVQSVDSQSRAISDLAKTEMLDLIDAGKGKFLGLLNDKAMNRDIVLELHGTDTGNAYAAKAAKQFQLVAEKLRERFNRAGGDVGKLDDWAMPHSHSTLRVAKSGADQWVNDVVPLLNRDRYVNEDGTLMSDTQMEAMLREAYLSIATDGANKIEAGQFTGGGKRADRGSEQRVLHFKGGDEWIAYQNQYGEGDLLHILMGHIDAKARDIALVERFGSNPNHMIRSLLDEAEKSEKLGGADAYATSAMRKRTERLYREVARNNMPVSQSLAEKFAAYRALNVASRLGSATLASFADEATMARTAMVHGLAYNKIFAKELALLNPAKSADRELARSLGLGMTEVLASLSRYNDDGLTTSATIAGRVAKLSNAAATAVMRASGLNALTAARKQGFSMMLMDKYGHMSRNKNWADLEAADKALLEGSGINELDWQIWQKATPLDRGDGSMILSADNIMAIPDADLVGFINPNTAKGNQQAFAMNPQSLREQAATRYMAHVLDEQGLAVIEAGTRERAKMYGYLEKGTWMGEIGRSALQFKSFTVSLMMRHGSRMMGQEGAWSKAAYGVPLFVMMSLLGGLVVQLRELTLGNDPQDMTQGSFWTNAVLAGGAMGVYGDVLKAGSTPDGRGVTDLIGGPILGDVKQVAGIANKGVRSTMGDDKANAGNEAVKFAKSHTPFANLWYTKAATDHMIFNQLQEIANPGYLRRKESRDKQKYDRTAWWSPDEMAPERAPDWEKAVGEE